MPGGRKIDLVLRAATLSALAMFLLAIGALTAPAVRAMELPPGFQARALPLPQATSPTWTDGLQKPTAIDFAPDGKLFVAERNGRVLEFDSIEDPTPTLVLSITDKVMAKGDWGMLGMKLDPEYPDQPYIYLSYAYDAPIGGDSSTSTHTHYADGSDDCDETNFSVDCLSSGRLARVAVDPATSIAVGGAVDPSSEQVLVNSWCHQATSHSIGDIEFDSSGALLMSGGDGASWGTIDYGQLGNPCGDPPDEGGALRSQDLRTPATLSDPTDYSGSLIRINRETGAALDDNPFSIAPLFGGGVEDIKAKRILAYGLRNPYRFTLRPGSGEVYIGDVGQDLWEEINRLVLPLGGGLNFGWPCYEGGPAGSLQMPRWQLAEKETHKPLCDPLYSNPGQVTAPFFAYPHKNTPGYDGGLFPSDACKPQSGSAVSGLAFYDNAGVPSESAFPARYDGALFFSDASRGCLWTMEAGTGGAPDPATVANFWVRQEGDPVFTPVDVVAGPDGALYVPNFYGNSIVQIRYFAGNKAPTAAIDPEGPPYGPLPMKVKLDASGSTDPDGDALSYRWDLDEDGSYDDGTGAVVEPEYTDATNMIARVRVTDTLNHSVFAQLTLYPGDLGPPQAAIVLPEASFEWAIGQPLDYEGTATDPDGEVFGSEPGSLTAHWEFTLQHCPASCHSHPITSSDSPSGTFIPPGHEYPAHLKLEFTAIDSRGLSDTETVEVFPRLIEIGVRSEPPGVPLFLEGVSSDEPLAATLIAGGSVTVSAPETATVDGVPYTFDAWSDGGALSHEVSSLDSVERVASYSPVPEENNGDGGGDETSSDLPQPPAAEQPPVLEPPPVAEQPRAHVTLASRPKGVPLRIGAFKRATPFSLEFPLQAKSFLFAPKRIERGGQTLVFRRWSKESRSLGRLPKRQVTITGEARYVGIYGPQAGAAGAAPRRVPGQ